MTLSLARRATKEPGPGPGRRQRLCPRLLLLSAIPTNWMMGKGDREAV